MLSRESQSPRVGCWTTSVGAGPPRYRLLARTRPPSRPRARSGPTRDPARVRVSSPLHRGAPLAALVPLRPALPSTSTGAPQTRWLGNVSRQISERFHGKSKDSLNELWVGNRESCHRGEQDGAQHHAGGGCEHNSKGGVLGPSMASIGGRPRSGSSRTSRVVPGFFRKL